jgi:hypothetical protein
MTFGQIEGLVGPLAASARKHPPVVGERPFHSQALAWLSRERKVERVDWR